MSIMTWHRSLPPRSRPWPARQVAVTGLVALLTACAAGPTIPPAGSRVPSASASEGSPGATPTARASTAPVSAAPQVATPTATTSPVAGRNVVRSGDTLSSIGRTFAASDEELVAWNAERYPSLRSDPGRLEAGWELIVAGDAMAPPPPSPPAPLPAPPASGGCVAGTRPDPDSLRVIRSVGDQRALALTFDMGGRVEPAVAITKLLVSERVCATLFLTGDAARTAAGQEVLALIRSNPGLLELGNHTQSHCNLRDGGGGSGCPAGRPTAAFIADELTDALAAMAAGGQDPAPYWRPPYGAYDDATIAAAADAGYGTTVLWTVDSLDWRAEADGGPTTSGLTRRIVDNATPGGIVLMHLGGWNTLDALPGIIGELRAEGYTLTSVSDLLD